MNDKKKIATVFGLSFFIILMCMIIFLSLVKNPNKGIEKKSTVTTQENSENSTNKETVTEQQILEEEPAEATEEIVSEDQLEQDISYIENMLEDLEQDTEDIETGLNDEAIVIE